jgi:hypothetical protein
MPVLVLHGPWHESIVRREILVGGEAEAQLLGCVVPVVQDDGSRRRRGGDFRPFDPRGWVLLAEALPRLFLRSTLVRLLHDIPLVVIPRIGGHYPSAYGVTLHGFLLRPIWGAVDIIVDVETMRNSSLSFLPTKWMASRAPRRNSGKAFQRKKDTHARRHREAQ